MLWYMSWAKSALWVDKWNKFWFVLAQGASNHVKKWKLQYRWSKLVLVLQFMYPCSRPGTGLFAVIYLGLVEPPLQSEWWCAGQSTAAAAAADCCLFEPQPESVGGPWTCGRSGCGPSRNVSRISDMQTPSPPLPCVWSCGILVTLAGDTGSHTPHTVVAWPLNVSSGELKGVSSVWRFGRTGRRCSSSPLCEWAWHAAAGSGQSWKPCCSQDEDRVALSPPHDAP